MSFSWLPPLLNEIADVAGVDAALALADARGGSRVTIPAKLKADHWLNEVVGPEAAEKLCKHFRVGLERQKGAQLDIPLGPKSPLNSLLHTNQRKIDEMLSAGIRPDEIARTLKVHRTTVFRRQALLRDPPPKTPDLFG